MINKKKTQSVIEYLIILTAIVAGIIAASRGIQSAVESRLNNAASQIGGIVNR